MKISTLGYGLAALFAMVAIAETAHGGAFDYAERWGGYWRQYEPSYGQRYEAPKTLYYGHAPEPAPHPVSPAARDAPLFLRLPQTPDGTHVTPYRPFYGRGRYYGPWFDPYYAPGRVTYGGVRYGWW